LLKWSSAAARSWNCPTILKEREFGWVFCFNCYEILEVYRQGERGMTGKTLRKAEKAALKEYETRQSVQARLK
jgi:hypothetical protein